MSAFSNWYAPGRGVILMTKDEHHGLIAVATCLCQSIFCAVQEALSVPSFYLHDWLESWFCLQLQLFNFLSSSQKT